MNNNWQVYVIERYILQDGTIYQNIITQTSSQRYSLWYQLILKDNTIKKQEVFSSNNKISSEHLPNVLQQLKKSDISTTTSKTMSFWQIYNYFKVHLPKMLEQCKQQYLTQLDIDTIDSTINNDFDSFNNYLDLVKQNPLNLEDIPQDKQTDQIIESALSKAPSTYQFLSKQDKEKRQWIEYLIKKPIVQTFKLLPLHLLSEQDIYTIIKNNHLTLQELPSEYLTTSLKQKLINNYVLDEQDIKRSRL